MLNMMTRVSYLLLLRVTLLMMRFTLKNSTMLLLHLGIFQLLMSLIMRALVTLMVESYMLMILEMRLSLKVKIF